MAEYYSKEAVVEFIRSYRHSTDVAFHMEEHLYEISTADVVEVVRCKDCDMAKSGSDEREMYCTFDHCYKGKNYFCADGRRKNEDSN